MVKLKKINTVLQDFNLLVNSNKARPFKAGEPLKVGIDLGTSSIVLAVLNQKDEPIYGSLIKAEVIRDGLIVNYMETVLLVSEMIKKAEDILGVELKQASTAAPSGTGINNRKVFKNVLESANLEVVKILDEPSAAALCLAIDHGSVVDIGGGTTGISILKNKQVIATIDEPTGGTHMSLVLAGHYHIPFAEAEQLKLQPQNEKMILAIIEPVIAKMAKISQDFLGKYPAEPVYIVGGASYFQDFGSIFTKYLGLPVQKPIYPQYVTPLGIAMSS